MGPSVYATLHPLTNGSCSLNNCFVIGKGTHTAGIHFTDQPYHLHCPGFPHWQTLIRQRQRCIIIHLMWDEKRFMACNKPSSGTCSNQVVREG
jgi:hypothetical protein